MKKIFLLASLLSLLTGCFYSDGCFYTPQMVNCVDKGKEWPYIALFQKKGELGKTNSEQRWIDVKSCGAINISKADNEFQIRGERDAKGIISVEVVKSFEHCMYNKGYIRLYDSDCGTQDPKWDKGKCNL